MPLNFDRKAWTIRVLFSLILLIVVFSVFASVVDKIWFREDDLGTIFSGLVSGWKSALRVFKADCRSFITPCNYQRTVPNFVSALWRPVQNYIFSVVYHIWGADAKIYFLLQVAFHTVNSMLFFILCSIFMPIALAFFSGIMFAFYPNIGWMVWISTLQNSLATFFLLLAVLCLCRFWHVKARSLWSFWYLISGIFYFLSLLSREMAIFLPFWLAIGVFLFMPPVQGGFWIRFFSAIKYCWIFFIANVTYALLRIWAFGFGTLDRTVSNIFLRFPFLNKLIFVRPVVVNPSLKSNLLPASCVCASSSNIQAESASSFASHFWNEILKWIEALFNLPTQNNIKSVISMLIVLSIIIFLFIAYKNKRLLLLWLFCGCVCLAWPGVLTYPSARYINLVYPFLIFIFYYGIFNFYQESKIWAKGAICMGILFATSVHGLCCLNQNISALNSLAFERFVYKQRFDDFFSQNSFDKNANFILVCSPYVSDIQSIFQFYLENLEAKVVFDPFTSFAEKGIMGCDKPYKVVGVQSEIKPIPGGFQLISQDPAHCGWWLRHSNFPVAWVAAQRAYRWTSQKYTTDTWYECSIGKFMINKMADQDCILEATFLYDPCWLSKDTIFVAWDSLNGKYFVIQ